MKTFQSNFRLNLRPELPSRGNEPRHDEEAFSLIEILVTMLLLSVITLGLLAMFNQTQRAFRSGMTQSDVLEGGRALTEWLVRDLEQITPANQPDVQLGNNANNLVRSTNFFAQLEPAFSNPQLLGLPGTTYQNQNGTQDRRTNIVQRFFFMTRMNQDWIGVGYLVVPDTASGLVGTLYRYSVTNWPRYGWFNLSGYFEANCNLALATAANNLPVTNMNRMAEGIAHLHLRTYDPSGLLINPDWPDPLDPRLRQYWFSRWMPFAWGATSDQVNSYYVYKAVPAELELEIGILENQVLERLKGINVAVAQRNYLSNQSARVHLFRQRIPVRSVDTTVY